MYRRLCSVLVLTLGCAFTSAAMAEDTVKDAAIGGAIGGALGGAVGAEVDGKKGAIIGAGVGAAAGAAIATQGDGDHHDGHKASGTVVAVPVEVEEEGKFCPPGQAKKGRC